MRVASHPWKPAPAHKKKQQAHTNDLHPSDGLRMRRIASQKTYVLHCFALFVTKPHRQHKTIILEAGLDQPGGHRKWIDMIKLSPTTQNIPR